VPPPTANALRDVHITCATMLVVLLALACWHAVMWQVLLPACRTALCFAVRISATCNFFT
jgi:hypothetical protein